MRKKDFSEVHVSYSLITHTNKITNVTNKNEINYTVAKNILTK
jgi:hypothetical protein